ncbi:uncharacterized protein I303_107273 [Kwoniella dejecticola CBS 10117]|uniref:Aldehyde dehydrogenase domain-containing protein n=1 Tax=Kwoniella dejecticola CBS 10117 TaxID=1296121 RepID=A0A1A5ZZ78_9TREE|nr:uncharacterized protein I303_06675 [Kwoniella dejecticola CBS 10117]OBR83116.1 hypothetical protein I303_06675 [Kwoniella dejecticola CBS 10117]
MPVIRGSMSLVIVSHHASRRTFTTSALSANTEKLPRVPLWLNGQAVTSCSGGSVIHRHPRTGEYICEVVVAGEDETRRAIQGSKKAFEDWRDVNGWERKGILQNVGRLMTDRKDTFTEALRADAPFADIVIGGDQMSAAHLLEGAANTAISVEGAIPQTKDDSFSMVLRQPYGPVLSIPAFNYPLTLAMRSIAYPLACGNTVILRASRLLPQFFGLLAPLFEDAGLPKGALQTLHFAEKDAPDRVEQIIAHRDVKMINFTGSVRLGKILAAKCGEHLKPSVMELGGKSIAIVLPDADLKLAANNILFGAFFNSGQVCMSTEQVLVHSDIAADFEQVLKQTAEEARWDEGMEMVRAGSGDGARSMYDDAVRGGAKILYAASATNASSTSGTTPSSAFPPTILTSLTSETHLYREESFAPLLSLHTFGSTSDILEYANSHTTGLSSSIFSRDFKESLELAKKLESGAVHINGMTIHDQHNLPHGGWKESGWGRFNGIGVIESFTQTKNVRFAKEAMLPLGAIYKGL